MTTHDTTPSSTVRHRRQSGGNQAMPFLSSLRSEQIGRLTAPHHGQYRFVRMEAVFGLIKYD
jgi:hypothetical protein